MVLSFILILLVALSGFVLTYFFAKSETFLWRVAAGNVVGSAIFGLVGFVIANFFGLSVLTASIALAISLAPLLLLNGKDTKLKFLLDWRAAKSRTQGIGTKKLMRVAYYVGFFLLFLFFFDRAMYQNSAGIFTGASQNLGDLPYHLGAIFSFTEGNNFPPQNPSFANAKFSYPFMADLLTAFLMKFGADVKSAMLVQNLFWAFSLLVILERFSFKLTGNKFAGKIAPVLLFFSGGLGFLWFFSEFREQSLGFFEFLRNLPTDYTIRQEGLRWGNSLNVLFITQRSLLLGMPLTIIVLQKLWEIFSSEKAENEKVEENSFSPLLLFSSSPFLIGLLAGTLPLIHLHSLAVLFVVTGFLFLLKPEKWREWLTFGVGVAVVAVPELLWSITDSATRTSEFFGWRFGWDKEENASFIWFWIINTGIFVPILALGIYLTQRREVKLESKNEKAKSKKEAEKEIAGEKWQIENRKSQVLFYMPFIFLFFVSNTAKLAPWEWDNIKVLIYWFVASLPFAALALAWIYERGKIWKLVAAGSLFILIFAGALDVWRIASGQVKIKVFDTDAVEIADDIRLRTPPNALFLNAPTFNSAVVISGRRSLMRYTGHLSSHGIDFSERFEDVKKMYQGDATTDILLRKYDIQYVLISPEERAEMQANEAYFEKFPLVAEVGEYKVYKVK